MEQIRLQKFLAQCGVSSRRKAEEFIKQGRVSVNGKIVTEMGLLVSESDEICFDKTKINKESRKVYILLNKPIGYVTTVKDQFNRKSVVDILEGIDERVFPIGRLDYDTSGLLLLTNDGDLAYRLTHPKHEIEKVYEAYVEGVPDNVDNDKFCSGVDIGGFVTSPAKIEVIERISVNSERRIYNYKNANSKIYAKSKVRIVIHEGKNRQVRKMCEAIGHKVVTLKRISIGFLNLGNLKEGSWRYLENEEIKRLREL